MRRGGPAVLLAVLIVAGAVAVGARIVDRSGPGASDDARTEVVVVDGPRGRILDRSGKVLVEDGTDLEVRIDPETVADLGPTARSDLLAALADLLSRDVADIEERLGVERTSVALASGVDAAVRDAIETDPERFPGVTVVPEAARRYRYGALAAHVLGYLGRATEQDLDARPGLADDALVGKAGVEAAMDDELRGQPGQVVYELDQAGQRVRELIDQREEPEPGGDVALTIDIDLQYRAEEGLAAEVARRTGVQDDGCFLAGGCDPQGAAAVALDPRNGEVLAMASYPTYDPALFAGGISTEDYAAISDPNRGDEHHFPLLNRALAGQYVPASTLKPFTAHAGLAADLLTPGERYDDTGIYRYSADCPVDGENNCSARNAGATPHGSIDLADALRVSSDTYFYALGDEAWRSRSDIGEEGLQDGIEAWGFGQPTGIDLPGEAPGRVPTPTWLREFSRALNADDPELAEEAGRWTAGISGNLAAGQGDVLASPLQLASAYATLANGGTIWRPRLIRGTTEPDATGEVDLPAEWRDPIIAGLDGVTKGPGGTATTAFSGFDQSSCPVMGKTGTAQVTTKNDTSVFAAVAPTPSESRESVIALSVVVEEAGFSGAAAVPVARRVLEPFVAGGCDIAGLGAAGGPDEAPLGGAIDVDQAVAEYVPSVGGSSD